MKKRFLLTSVMMLLLTVFALSTATYAWFSMSTTNTVKDFTITAASAEGGLEISIDGSTFSNSSVEIANPTLSALDVTTNDGVEFYKATDFDAVSGNVTNLEKSATANVDYFEYPLYFRTSVAGEISLNLGRSYIIPASLKANLTESAGVGSNYKFTFAKKNASDGNLSNLGDFTRDWIAAATRISFQVTDYQHSNTKVWDTTAKMEADDFTALNTTSQKLLNVCEPFGTGINLSTNTVSNTWDVVEATKTPQALQAVAKKTGTGATGYGLVNTDADNKTYTVSQLLTSNSVVIANVGTWGPEGSQTEGLPYKNGETAIVEVTVRVWIEGQDTEAKSALALGQFITGLQFGLTSKKQADFITLSYSAGSVSSNEGVVSGFNWAQLPSAVTKFEIYKKGETSADDVKIFPLEDTDNGLGTTSYVPTTADALSKKLFADGTYYLKVTYLLEKDGKEVKTSLPSGVTPEAITGDATQKTFKIDFTPTYDKSEFVVEDYTTPAASFTVEDDNVKAFSWAQTTTNVTSLKIYRKATGTEENDVLVKEYTTLTSLTGYEPDSTEIANKKLVDDGDYYMVLTYNATASDKAVYIVLPTTAVKDTVNHTITIDFAAPEGN